MAAGGTKTFGSEYTFEDGAAITTSDTDAQPQFKAIWVGTTGDITVVTKSGNTLLFKNVPVGWFECAGVSLVKSTGTTASDMVGVY